MLFELLSPKSLHHVAPSDEGGAAWGVIASLIETCKLNGIEPNAYLTKTLTRIVHG